MEIVKRILKGVLIWLLTMLVMYLVFSSIYPTGSKMPLFISFFVLIFPVYCAVHFSKSKLNINWRFSKKQKPTPLTVKPSPRKKVSATATKQAVQSTSLARIDKMEGHEFEQFTAGLLRKLGYERVEVTPGSGDQGVDVIAVKDGKRYAIQCKRYGQKLGNKPVQEVFAGKTIYGCSVAVVLTNNYFTDGAKEAAKATGVELWDRDTLCRMLDYANFKKLV